MGKEQKKSKQMISHESIYKIMQWLPLVVSGAFFLKNVVSGNVAAMLTIGICLVAYVSILVLVKKRNVSLYAREYILSVTLLILIFVISLNSGASYSDDFSLFMAVIGLSGMYLEPKFTRIQIVVSDVLLILMYMIHPEKAESLSQYILCMVVFTLAASLVYLVIKRGRAFIEMSEVRARESELLLESIRAMGAELQHDFSASSAKIEEGTRGLQEGSSAIADSALAMSDNCGLVRSKIQESGHHMEQLSDGVRKFEDVLMVYSGNVGEMWEQVGAVSELIGESGSVFHAMEEQMGEIAGIAKQLNDISFKLTILSLNAAVEAAHAGEFGAGFEVLAGEMRALSEASGVFSEQVGDAVKAMSESVERTSERFAGSEAALKNAENAVTELVNSFAELNDQFGTLYGNIENQIGGVQEIDNIFYDLNDSVEGMLGSSNANQMVVEVIVEEMNVFRGNIERIVENTQKI